MGQLARIIKAITAGSSEVQARLHLSRLSLKLGVRLSRIDATTPDDPALEARLMAAAAEILGRPITLAPAR
ncbi:MAG: hypothetical protein ABGY41_06600 [Candidatus Poribacteria bacterium]